MADRRHQTCRHRGRSKTALRGGTCGTPSSGGRSRFRRDGENHLWTPESLSLFRQAVQANDPEKYKAYANYINDQSKHLCTLRGLFEFADTQSIPVGEVESVESILHRFVSGAMCLGSLSPEAHEAIAVAMNRIGAMSNCGEGGEDPAREQPGPNGEDRRSAIRQIASGRFGVTIDYLANARDLQIKMAQGAKPGEGGAAPRAQGGRSDSACPPLHAARHADLPPPHHDIYSI
ncbi:MAG: glutamate synthase-related protein, partial [Victivallis sp.]